MDLQRWNEEKVKYKSLDQYVNDYFGEDSFLDVVYTGQFCSIVQFTRNGFIYHQEIIHVNGLDELPITFSKPELKGAWILAQ